MNKLSVLILAAGKGTRMKSGWPKVFHSVGGISMVERVWRTVSELKPAAISVVVGFQGEQVKRHLEEKAGKIRFFTQKSLNGSGGAVRQAMSWIKAQPGQILIACGDAPLIRAGTLKDLMKAHQTEGNKVTVLTTIVPNPRGYGRIVRSFDRSVQRIVEELDATAEERAIQEINTGTYIFNAKTLSRVLPKIKANNAKKEFYLTDTLALIREEGGRVGAFVCPDSSETIGINHRGELAQAEAIVNRRKIEALMESGVSFIDPSSCFISENVKIAADTVIWPQTFISGATEIGSRCVVGPWAHITDCRIENDVIIRASFAESAEIRRGARVGPYSRVRPKSVLGPNVHLGNFSEVKNAQLAEGAKVNHLSYLGDSKVGKNVNIGAGTITCNYDGVKKSPTVIEDHAFIGSNANLIAPIRIGAHAVVGAGSSLNENVPAWALAVERAPRIVKPGWAKKRFKKEPKR